MYRRDLMNARMSNDPWDSTPPPDVKPPQITPGMFDDPAVRAQRELMARRDALMAQRTQQQTPPPAPSAAPPPLNAKQEFFVRQIEFLYYLKTLDKLITQFDRENRFELGSAIDRTTRALNETKTIVGALRGGVTMSVRLLPNLPKTVFARLAQKTFIRYILWRPALDLSR